MEKVKAKVGKLRELKEAEVEKELTFRPQINQSKAVAKVQTHSAYQSLGKVKKSDTYLEKHLIRQRCQSVFEDEQLSKIESNNTS